MVKKRFDSYFKVFLILVLTMAILVPASVLFNRHRLNNSPLPEVIAGTWTGQVEIFTDFKKGKSPSPYSEDWIKIEIT